MLLFRRSIPILLILAMGLLLASCQEKGGGSGSEVFPIFGNGAQDDSEVIATVGKVQITQMDLDQHFIELAPKLQKRHDSQEGRQLLLKGMVDEVLYVLGAEKLDLLANPDVIQDLTSQRRVTLVGAMKSLEILKNADPSEEEILSFYNDNRKEFMQLAKIRARHVECLTVEDADQAYQLLVADGSPGNFIKVATEFTVNTRTLAQNAEVGWYNKGGYMPLVVNGRVFIDKTQDMAVGLHPPVQVMDHWHVVEILERQEGRTMTFNEARAIVKNTMLPGYQDGLVKDYLLDAREIYEVTMLGAFAPGNGLDPDTIMARAALVTDPFTKVEFYRMIYTDFPNSDRADDALFMCALVSMDNYMDHRLALRYLDLLMRRYPDTELKDDVAFIKKNMYKPGKMNPATIEDLRKD